MLLLCANTRIKKLNTQIALNHQMNDYKYFTFEILILHKCRKMKGKASDGNMLSWKKHMLRH